MKIPNCGEPKLVFKVNLDSLLYTQKEASGIFKNRPKGEESRDSRASYPTSSASNQSFGFGEMGSSILAHPKLYASSQNGFCCGDPTSGIMKDDIGQTIAGGGCDTVIGPSNSKVQLNLDNCGGIRDTQKHYQLSDFHFPCIKYR